jgi:hypothetical protein
MWWTKVAEICPAEKKVGLKIQAVRVLNHAEGVLNYRSPNYIECYIECFGSLI